MLDFARRVSVSARPLKHPVYMMGCIKTLLNLRKQYILAAYVHLEEFSSMTSEYLKVWNYRKKFGGLKQHKISGK